MLGQSKVEVSYTGRGEVMVVAEEGTVQSSRQAAMHIPIVTQTTSPGPNRIPSRSKVILPEHSYSRAFSRTRPRNRRRSGRRSGRQRPMKWWRDWGFSKNSHLERSHTLACNHSRQSPFRMRSNTIPRRFVFVVSQ